MPPAKALPIGWKGKGRATAAKTAAPAAPPPAAKAPQPPAYPPSALAVRQQRGPTAEDTANAAAAAAGAAAVAEVADLADRVHQRVPAELRVSYAAVYNAAAQKVLNRGVASSSSRWLSFYSVSVWSVERYRDPTPPSPS